MKSVINNKNDVLDKLSTKQLSKVLPMKGDIFFVQDSTNEISSHRIIRQGQSLTWNLNPEIIHAGIALDSENTIEMSNSGINHYSFNNIHGQKVILFRCIDQNLSDLAADLAYNIEGSYLAESYQGLKPSENIRYSFMKAIISAFNSFYQMNNYQKNELEKLVKNFDLPNALYCSELVVLLFSMSHLILEKSNQAPKVPINFNLHYTNPSQLYNHLSQESSDWERIDLQVKREGNKSYLFKDLNVQDNKNSMKIISTAQLLTNNSGLFSKSVANDSKLATKGANDELFNQANKNPSYSMTP